MGIKSGLLHSAVLGGQAVAAGSDYSALDAILSGNSGAYWDPANATHVWQHVDGTVAAGNGDPVGRLDDLSGNNHHFVAVANDTTRPTLVHGGSGEWYLDFDGINDAMVTDSYHLAKTTEGEWFVGAAAYFNNVTGIHEVLNGDEGAGNPRVWQFRSNDTAFELIGFDSGENPGFDNDGTLSATTFYRLAGEAAYNAGSETLQTYINAVAQGSATSIASLFDGTTVIRLGVDKAASAFFPGRFYRGFHVNRALTAGEKTSVDTYLNGNRP